MEAINFRLDSERACLMIIGYSYECPFEFSFHVELRATQIYIYIYIHIEQVSHYFATAEASAAVGLR